ncbi:Exosome complex protein [Sphaceloma murrayae]|uniref:Exosome complex protein n=1 Tax=Sphaceloma murrayae TaxID=2082308 RepID=A0A2K1QX08_9PEZI|nr:Exosome complex protein [Sphaceloma murrayae]
MATEGDSSRVESLLESLAEQIDGVDTALEPLLSKALSATTSKVPLLDKAKIYIHTAYAIESLVFSYLNLNGVDAKTHPVFAELKRVRSYFEKVKGVESEGPAAKLDKGAATRFIKHALSGNDEFDRNKSEAQQAQHAGAKRKADALADRYSTGNRFGAVSKKMKDYETNGNLKDAGSDGPVPEAEKRVKSTGTRTTFSDEEPEVAPSDTPDGREQSSSEHMDASSPRRKKERKHHKNKKHDTKDVDESPVHPESVKVDKQDTKRHKHSHPPKDAHQAFQSLLSKSGGSAKTKSGESSGKKKKRHTAGSGISNQGTT